MIHGELIIDNFAGGGGESTGIEDEYEEPTAITEEITWDMNIVVPCRMGGRKRSTTELKF